jgi:hypothetical protein
MSLATPVERVVEILKGAGYRQLGLPLVVASIPFDFAAALVGTGRTPDLIVVIDTMQDADSRTRQKIDSLGRAMDVAGSRRPLTAVLAGPRPADPTLTAIGRVCRVLPIGTPTGSDAERLLHEWLQVLLPLELPDTGEVGATVASELALHLPNTLEAKVRESLLKSSLRGEEAVRAGLRDLITDALDASGRGDAGLL